MIVVACVVACVAVALVVAFGVFAWFRSVDVLVRRQTRHQVVVELRGGETFKGVMVAVDANTVLLRNVKALGSEQVAPAVVDGELLIPRADIKYLQRP